MSEQAGPSPVLFFESINAYQKTAALRAAIEMDLFTAIGEAGRTAGELAARCEASARGTRILCDYLVVAGFLTKTGSEYGLTQDSAAFLDRRSPAYLGGATEFLLSPTLTGAFEDLASVVRTGTTPLGGEGTVEPDHPVWVKFARAMMPIMALPAREMVRRIPLPTDRELRILDIAAGHGLFGIAFGREYPSAEVTALDWPAVLEVAKENVSKAGLENRFHTIEGDAFEAGLDGPYDMVLLTNFLHHFDARTCEKLLRRVHGALAEDGRAVTLEFVPNEDRVSPPGSAVFALTMLATTGNGDAYTFAEYDAMFRAAGFSHSELVELQPGMERVVVSRR